MKKTLIILIAALFPFSLNLAHAGIDTDNGIIYDRGDSTAVPELDELGAPIALALIAGIAGIAIERRRRNKK